MTKSKRYISLKEWIKKIVQEEGGGSGGSGGTVSVFFDGSNQNNITPIGYTVPEIIEMHKNNPGGVRFFIKPDPNGNYVHELHVSYGDGFNALRLFGIQSASAGEDGFVVYYEDVILRGFDGVILYHSYTLKEF